MPDLILTMQHHGDTAQDLPAYCDAIDTGYMGSCVSVIVGWQPNAKGRMERMRGFHGAGWLREVNFASLLDGVPNLPTTQVWMISGDDNRRYEGMAGFQAHRHLVIDEVHNVAGLKQVKMIRFYHRRARVRVDRFGQVTDKLY